MKIFTQSFYVISFFWVATMLACQSGVQEIKSVKADMKNLPKEIEVEGKIVDAIEWTDKVGKNYLLATTTDAYQASRIEHPNEGLDVELHIFHYSILDGKTTFHLRHNDGVFDCPLDIEASFIKDVLKATDLNQDGVAEVWFMYKTACRGDVSPGEMKLYMIHGEQHYSMSGQTMVKLSESEFVGGDYEFNDAFKKGPPEFKEYAQKLWDQNRMQVWE